MKTDPAAPKPFSMSSPAYVGIKVLSDPEQRAAIEEALATPEKAWGLYREAAPIGKPAPGEDIRAVCIQGMWLVFVEKANGLELAFLITDAGFRAQGIKFRAARGVNGLPKHRLPDWSPRLGKGFEQILD